MNGWKKASEVQIGDYLFGSDGKPTKVLGVYPQGITDAYNVEFSDGTHLVTSGDHLWAVHERKRWDKLKGQHKVIKRTKEMSERLYDSDGHKKYDIPIIKPISPIRNEEKILPIDPYLFGYWLGNGSSYKAEFCTMDIEVVQAFRSKYPITIRTHQNAGKATEYGIRGGFVSTLKKLGVIGNKHIPIQYLLSDIDSRFALLQGMMDSDGTCGAISHQCSLCFVNDRLRKDARTLIESLGMYCTECGPIIMIRSPKNPFRLERKSRKYKPLNKRHFSKRFITAITKVQDRETICFRVDSEDHLFAAGRDLILTHNTELVVKNFISYGLAVNPSAKFLHLSYSDDLANDNSEEVRDIVKSEEYKRVFPYVDIKKTSDAKKKWYTTEGGGMYATASGGQVTGFGAGAVDDENDLSKELEEFKPSSKFAGALIIDDPVKPEDAISDTPREKVNQRFETTIRNRVNSRNTPIIIIMQRLHEHDLCGYLMETEPGEWTVLSLPAIIYENGKEKALWEFKHTIEELHRMQRVNSYVFETQYMQNPTPMEGLMYGKFKTYEAIPITNRAIRKNYTDTADTGSDYLCSIDYIDTEIGNFILDVLFTQKEMEFTEPETAKMLTKDQISKANIESNNGGRGFARNVEKQMRMIGNSKTQVSWFHQSKNKEVRIFTRSSEVMNLTYFPADWERRWPEFASQLKTYRKRGKNAHDDACDALTGTVEMRGEVDVLYYKKEEIGVNNQIFVEIHPNINGLFIMVSYCVVGGKIFMIDCLFSDSLISVDQLINKTDGNVQMEIPVEMKHYADDYRKLIDHDLWVREESTDKKTMIESYKSIIKTIYFPESDDSFSALIANMSDYDGINSFEGMYVLSCVCARAKSSKVI